MSRSRDPWWRGAVMYQIYPRSFQDSDGDGVGDLAGITQRLEHVRDLGVDGVWLSPFFASPMRDFGYDVSDYCAVAPEFGTLDDFRRLVEKAHKSGLKVIIDQVWSHSSSDHAWFRESREDRTNARADWYVWADPMPDGSPPNNWQAWFGGPCWTWDARRGQYYLHNFLPSQPDLNLRHPDVQAAILDVARFWLDMGVDGFRLDVANYYLHDARLRNNPPRDDPAPALPRNLQHHVYNANQPETLDFLNRVRALMDDYGATMAVAEIASMSPERLSRMMREYTCGADRLHTAYAFDFLRGPLDAEFFKQILTQWRDDTVEGWPSWSFCNHDFARVVTRWGNGADPDVFAPMALALLLSMRGAIFLYQGEELGLPEAEIPYDRLRDPAGVSGWPRWKGRDGCRTPMVWDEDAANAGFSTASDTWLPIDPAHPPRAVLQQAADPGSVLGAARALIAARKMEPAMIRGDMRVEEATHPLLILSRNLGGDTVICVFNLSDENQILDADDDLIPLFLHNTVRAHGKLGLKAYGAAWLKRP